MKLNWALFCSSACVSGTAAVAQTGISELESRVLSGDLSPKAAIIEYCKGRLWTKPKMHFVRAPKRPCACLSSD